MPKVIDPKDSPRATAYELWMKARNPMVTLFKTFDVTKLIKISKRKRLKFNMLLCYCIVKAASDIEEFYTLPVGDQPVQYDSIAVSVIVKNKNGDINSCDILYASSLYDFNRQYLKNTNRAAEHCENVDLSKDSMVIGTSAITQTEIDGAVGMDTGIFNNPFIIWGRVRKRRFRYELPISFQFHHTQMDGAQAGEFLENLQNEIKANDLL